MGSNPLDDEVARQYQRWVYPEPIQDLPAWLAGNWQWFDPSHAHRMLWPDRPYAPEIDILVAGCGSNQAAVLAYTNPRARVLAVDVSEPSLAHHRSLAQKYGLQNLETVLLPIEEIPTLGRDFDLIMSTGVLHHLADPAVGMAALAGCLRRDGVMAVMLYGRYGRVGVEMLQAVFRDMGLSQDEASLEVVLDTLDVLPPDHPLRPYLALAPDLGSDAGVVDTFLHGRDRSYTVGDCLDLVDGAGLAFQGWFLKAPYAPPPAAGDALRDALESLPEEGRWAVMERLNPGNACHFFMACRRDRPHADYVIDFAGAAFLGYVPALRYRCAMEDAGVSRQGALIDLDDGQLALLAQVDGQQTIAEVIVGAASHPALSALDADGLREYARNFFRSLWDLDVLAVQLRG